MRYDSPASDVLTVRETADLLKVSQYTVRELARRGEIPGRKIGREWRFARRAVMDLLQSVPDAAQPPRGYDVEPISSKESAQLDAAWAALESGKDPGVPLEDLVRWVRARVATGRARDRQPGNE